MKCLLPLLTLLLAGCSMFPEQGPAMKELSGVLIFREKTALPETATAHVVLAPALSGADAKPLATLDVPARTGISIPFTLKFPAAKVGAGGDYLVLAQVLDHGKVWYSNLSSPTRINFLAEPGEISVELRPEQL